MKWMPMKSTTTTASSLTLILLLHSTSSMLSNSSRRFLVSAFSPPTQKHLYHPRQTTITTNHISSKQQQQQQQQQQQHLHLSTILHAAATTSPQNPIFTSNTKCFRPTFDDVTRISYGKPAKQKGVGSRGVPHRLNSSEREIYDRARQKGVLEIIGSAWRSQRRDAPLLNTYRNWCDAKGRACIVLSKGKDAMMGDLVSVDLSPLRMPMDFEGIAKLCVESVEVPPSCMDYDYDSFILDEKDDEEDKEEEEEQQKEQLLNAWNNRPIYQLSPYEISWTLPRNEAKQLGKKLAILFDTAETKKVVGKSRKPGGVKAGKGRRSGGYGIG